MKLYIFERKTPFGATIEIEAKSIKEAKKEAARYENIKIQSCKLLGKKEEFER